MRGFVWVQPCERYLPRLTPSFRSPQCLTPHLLSPLLLLNLFCCIISVSLSFCLLCFFFLMSLCFTPFSPEHWGNAFFDKCHSPKCHLLALCTRTSIHTKAHLQYAYVQKCTRTVQYVDTFDHVDRKFSVATEKIKWMEQAQFTSRF